MNATSSGVAFSAAKMRSPSFSRSSSSMTTTALPAAISATARSTVSSLVILACSLPLLLLPDSMNHLGRANIARPDQRPAQLVGEGPRHRYAQARAWCDVGDRTAAAGIRLADQTCFWPGVLVTTPLEVLQYPS